MNDGDVLIQTLSGLGLWQLGMSNTTEGRRALLGATRRCYLVRLADPLP